MTREEAIKRIQNHMDVHRIGEYTHIKLGEALNMAISALRDQEERRWIPVTERLPEPWKEVIVFSNFYFFETAVYLGIPGEWRLHGTMVCWNMEASPTGCRCRNRRRRTTMQRCSKKAYSICPGREACGPIEDAVFQDGSHCQIFNDSINGIVELRPLMPNILRTGDPCPCCGQPIKTTDPVLLRLLTLIRDEMFPPSRSEMGGEQRCAKY